LPFCQEPKHIARRRRPGVRPSSASQCRRDQHRIVAANKPVDLIQQFRLHWCRVPDAIGDEMVQLIIGCPRQGAPPPPPTAAREQTFQDRGFGPRRPDANGYSAFSWKPATGLFPETGGKKSLSRPRSFPMVCPDPHPNVSLRAG
jgi:hypothetical protein